MTADIWASEARSDRWWQGQEPQQVIGIIEALVQGNIDPSSASKQITSLYEPLVKADPSSVTVIWGILFRAVRGVGQDEAIARKLVDFVLRIQQSDDVLDDSGQQVKFGSHAVWRDLPEFSYSFGLYCICTFFWIHVNTNQEVADDPGSYRARRRVQGRLARPSTGVAECHHIRSSSHGSE